MPVPTQVVLASTISRGKNLRSIVTKILIQMNAKLPFSDKPMMVVGISQFKKRAQKFAIGMCASMNNSCNKYFSRVSFS